MALPAPKPSMTMIGSTRKVTTAQATPAMAVTIWPMKPARSSMARRIIDTSAETKAQGSIRPARRPAPRRALRMVGSPPPRRSWAALIRAALKKIVT